MKRWLALAALLIGALFGAAARAADVELLRESGPPDRRFNIAVLGDGYRSQDQALLTQNAQAVIDYVFGVTPLAQYAQFFNVKLVHVVSNDDGADNGSYGAERDTALGAYFNCDDIDRLLCIDDGKVYAAAAEDVPEFNFTIVLVNDPKYGGSGGPVCVSSSNEQSFEVLAHELGHSLARLADEYSDAGNQPACDAQQDCPEANATLRTLRSQIKWRDWIETTTPLPTPATYQYAAVTGLFEGARYTPTGVYRPALSCKMRDLGSEYCAVCTEQFVRSIWSAENIRMIEAATPPQPDVPITGCEPIELSVTSPPISPSSYRYVWSVDGQALADSDNSTQLLPAVLKQGSHVVEVAIEDSTALVRSDPAGLLDDSFSWTVSITRDDCAPVTAGGAGGAGDAGGPGDAGSAGSVGSWSGAGSGSGGAAGTSAGEAGIPLGGSNGGGSEPGGASAGGVEAGGASSAGPSGAGGPVSGVPVSGGTASEGNASSPSPPPRDAAGCGCSVPGNSGSGAVWLSALATAVVLARRRRPHR
jgi:MYXO-CTERM domain-containing protein